MSLLFVEASPRLRWKNVPRGRSYGGVRDRLGPRNSLKMTLLGQFHSTAALIVSVLLSRVETASPGQQRGPR